MTRLSRLFLICCCLLPGGIARWQGQDCHAQSEVAQQQDNASVRVVTEGLLAPRALALHPRSGDVYIADAGRQEVLRWDGQRLEPVIRLTPAGDSPEEESTVPTSLAWLDDQLLVVGTARTAKASGQILLFEIPPPGAPPLTRQQQLGEPRNLPPDDELGPESVLALIHSGPSLFVLSQAESGAGGLLRMERDEAGELGQAQRQWKIPGSLVGTLPRAGTLSPEGHLALGLAPSGAAPKPAQLTFYAQDDMLLESFDTGLSGIHGLAYHGPTGQLLVLAQSPDTAQPGGLYRLVAGGPGKCQAQLLVPLSQPTALAVSRLGDVWVTVVGQDEANPPNPAAQLMVIPATALEVSR